METKAINKTKNAVNVIHPYRTKYGIWCFDDEDLGIVAEPFVGDINTIIDAFAPRKKQITVFISSKPIHECTLSLTRADELGEGMYELDGNRDKFTYGIRGWLCPCLLNYFPDYPEKIYAKIK